MNQKDLLRGLFNVRMPISADEEFLSAQDKYLREEICERGVTDIEDLNQIQKDIYLWQGDYGLWQCSLPCHNKTYDNEEVVGKMLTYQGYTFDEDGALIIPEGVTPKMEISSKLIPHCPVCGRPMMMNLRADDRFVQDEGWDNAANNYSDFVVKCEKKKTLFLELGVGGNTPTIIKYPFWRMVQKNRDAVYACINYGEASCPKEIKDRSICINGDIGELLTRNDLTK